MNLSTADVFRHLSQNLESNVKLEGDALKRYQDAILLIADDIISVCEENDITYHLTGGSALGAVRHSGFIPWDDDIDIDILGSDFDRFIEIFREKYGDRYWIHTCKTPGYGMVVNRVLLKGTVFRGREDIDNDECGFFVDLIRIENTFNNVILRYVHGVLCMGMGFLLSCRNFYKNRTLMRDLAQSDKSASLSFRLKIFIGRLLSFLSVEKWAEATQFCYSLCKNNNSRYVTVPAGRKHYFGEMRLRSDFVETTDAEFEGYSWKIPKNFDSYLKGMYGENYMQVPADDEHEGHIILELRFPGEK